MSSYFDYISSKLTLDEMLILGYLNDKQANTAFKSVKRKQILEEIKLTMSRFRNALLKLDASGFIETVTGTKEHRIYVTEYGQMALSKQLQEEEI